jgi:hypothetical protein
MFNITIFVFWILRSAISPDVVVGVPLAVHAPYEVLTSVFKTLFLNHISVMTNTSGLELWSHTFNLTHFIGNKLWVLTCRKPRLLWEQISVKQISEHKSELGLATVDGPGCKCTFPDIININTIKAWHRTGTALQSWFMTSECASDGNKIILYSNFIRKHEYKAGERWLE